RTGTVVAVLLAVSLLTVLVQVFRGQVRQVSHVTTVSAVEYETVDTMICAVRDEYLVSGVEDGYVVPLIGRGDRVANGESIAAVFSTDEAASSYTEYLRLQSEIEYYNRISSYSLSQYTDFGILADNTYASLYALSTQIRRGNFDKVGTSLSEFRSDLTMKQTASGMTANFTDTIRQLNNRASEALSAAGRFTSVTATRSGYFYPDSDGYENLLSYDDISLITVGDVDAALAARPAERQETPMGRLINSFDWYFVCALDKQVANSFSVGSSFEVELPYNASDPFRAEVYKINESAGERTAVVFRVREMNDELASLRTSYASIRLNSYSGFKIPTEAVRIVDGMRGVFILRNNIANFRTFDVLYSTESYTIVDRCRNEDGEYLDYIKIDDPGGEIDEQTGQIKQKIVYCLKLYDEVITEGVDLYDGKVVD
ncbi:MAG: hypothetical protein IJL26_06055, partial [Clostridia bacterium]|nr:hypothetical protein [Clostridia bacterium]